MTELEIHRSCWRYRQAGFYLGERFVLKIFIFNLDQLLIASAQRFKKKVVLSY